MKEKGKEAGKKKAGWQEKRNREKVRKGREEKNGKRRGRERTVEISLNEGKKERVKGIKGNWKVV